MLLLAAQALERDRAGRRAPDRLGVLAQRLGVEVAGRRDHRHAVERPRRGPLARERLDRGPRGARVRHPREAVVGRERHVDDRAPRRPGAARLVREEPPSAVPRRSAV